MVYIKVKIIKLQNYKIEIYLFTNTDIKNNAYNYKR